MIWPAKDWPRASKGKGGNLICKNCNSDMPDPPPQVIVKEVVKQVDHSDGHYWVRVAACAALVLMTLILTIGAVNALTDYREIVMMTTPDLKVEITEYDHAGRPTKKVIR